MILQERKVTLLGASCSGLGLGLLLFLLTLVSAAHLGQVLPIAVDSMPQGDMATIPHSSSAVKL